MLEPSQYAYYLNVLHLPQWQIKTKRPPGVMLAPAILNWQPNSKLLIIYGNTGGDFEDLTHFIGNVARAMGLTQTDVSFCFFDLPTDETVIISEKIFNNIFPGFEGEIWLIAPKFCAFQQLKDRYPELSELKLGYRTEQNGYPYNLADFKRQIMNKPHRF
jgi:hypothetical protein